MIGGERGEHGLARGGGDGDFFSQFVTVAALDVNRLYTVEQSNSLGADANWNPVSVDWNINPQGDGRIHTLTFPRPQNDSMNFFRIDSVISDPGGS